VRLLIECSFLLYVSFFRLFFQGGYTLTLVSEKCVKVSRSLLLAFCLFLQPFLFIWRSRAGKTESLGRTLLLAFCSFLKPFDSSLQYFLDISL
jgi:hypothetical protein